MTFNQALAITLDEANLELLFGKDIFHPTKTEKRYLKDIRNSLLDKQAVGPELLYTIAMDVGKKEHQEDLIKRNLLYGVVGYNNGVIGNELVRSQGHIHAISASCHSSTPEVYEIWQGKAYIYMQEFVDDQPGRCIVVFAKPGDIVIVPPNWAHYTVNASQDKKMLFGAWCIRDYAFEYKEIRQRQGLAYYPVIENSHIKWRKNTHYAANLLEIKTARAYPEFKLSQNNLYTQYEEDSERFDFVTNPLKYQSVWTDFQP
ncbi:glucose-6-phosphate isomerase family protein [Enterococcus crotali]|uniref:glucose-6-phosphate isomerase family protein n=1 Tax=Enterococcus crotali TaxID=1453587 RepID=UPI00046FADFA|nr:glucose-6-phosphate isomerase family protein [Enterococcus crotali]